MKDKFHTISSDKISLIIMIGKEQSHLTTIAIIYGYNNYQGANLIIEISGGFSSLGAGARPHVVYICTPSSRM